MKRSKKKKIVNEYSVSWDEVYNQLPSWKKQVIDECLKNKTEDFFYDSFVKEVIRRVEDKKSE